MQSLKRLSLSMPSPLQNFLLQDADILPNRVIEYMEMFSGKDIKCIEDLARFCENIPCLLDIGIDADDADEICEALAKWKLSSRVSDVDIDEAPSTLEKNGQVDIKLATVDDGRSAVCATNGAALTITDEVTDNTSNSEILVNNTVADKHPSSELRTTWRSRMISELEESDSDMEPEIEINITSSSNIENDVITEPVLNVEMTVDTTTIFETANASADDSSPKEESQDLAQSVLENTPRAEVADKKSVTLTPAVYEMPDETQVSVEKGIINNNTHGAGHVMSLPKTASWRATIVLHSSDSSDDEDMTEKHEESNNISENTEKLQEHDETPAPDAIPMQEELNIDDNAEVVPSIDACGDIRECEAVPTVTLESALGVTSQKLFVKSWKGSNVYNMSSSSESDEEPADSCEAENVVSEVENNGADSIACVKTERKWGYCIGDSSDSD